MPYVSTPPELIYQNEANPNPLISFTKVCPRCGQKLIFSDKSATCNNYRCPGRVTARMANMFAKLGIKGFAQESMEKLNVSSFKELSELPKEVIVEKLHSEVLAQNLIDAINEFKTTPNYDYILIGALGFTDVAQGTWKKIFNEYTLDDLLSIYEICGGQMLHSYLVSIKGIGEATANTIVQELPVFFADIVEFVKLHIIKQSKGLYQRKIRLTGFRDPELVKQLCDMGYDASDKGVTKDTFILLVPSVGFTSSKTKAAGPSTMIVPVDEFRSNMAYWLKI
jgi:hypothetical protein